ncbi:putative acetyltransferase [Haloferax mucosum ATCC BAA-1512]|uniref:Putative acetyltransferase n=1 Tax=Haloferax mucosum ATCC BAA-1512 TaxID=662479 RepID=M0IEV6_9EURY|nr:GNAT family N-acetyltransferase [Haloferax mucosum]ELZ95310.1 putative acetyltransferase [Haloferax mucosum ATCC BAA-1512]
MDADSLVTIDIRPPASRAEIRGVWRVNARCWVKAYDHILPPEALPDRSTPPDETRLRDRLDYANTLNETESGRHVVAVETQGETDEVVGFAATRWNDDETKSFVGDDDAGLWLLYVEPSRWGEGIGSALLADVAAAVPDGYDRLVLEAFAENEAAIGFYRSQGFETLYRDESEVGGEMYPVVVMARPLTG